MSKKNAKNGDLSKGLRFAEGQVDYHMTEDEVAHFKAWKQSEIDRKQAAKEAAERIAKRDEFKKLIPERDSKVLAQLVADAKPLLSIRAVHPDHGIVEGIIAGVATIYTRKGVKRGEVVGLEIDIVSPVAYKQQVASMPDNSPIYGETNVYSVSPEWIIELGNKVVPQFDSKAEGGGKPPKTSDSKKAK